MQSRGANFVGRRRQGFGLDMIFNQWSAQRSYSTVWQQTKNSNQRTKGKFAATNMFKQRACVRLQAKHSQDMTPLQKIHSAVLRMGKSTGCLLGYFELFFGPARAQKIPCDSSIQNEDESRPLTSGDSKSHRSVVGLLLYVARDRVDVMCDVKELSSRMAAPTLLALQRLRKLIGYLKSIGDMGMKLSIPEFG